MTSDNPRVPPPVPAPPPPGGQADRGARRRVGLSLGVAAMSAIGLLLLAGIVLSAGAAGALAAIAAAVLPAPLLVAVILLIDRYEPEPKPVLALAFGWGATAAVFLAGMFNLLGFALFAGAFGPEIGQAATVVLVAPFGEELLKGAALLVVFWRRRQEFNGVIDGLVYSGMVGLGFAVGENLFYYVDALVEGQAAFAAVVVIRGVFSPFAHPLFTAMFGIGLALATEVARRRGLLAVAGLGAAMFLHALWNGATYLGAGFLLVYLGVFVPLFAVVIVSAVLASRREARLLRTHLWPDVQRGLLTPDEVDKLASARRRRAAERESARLGGKAAQRRRRAFHHAATRLAFLRHRRAVGGAHAPGPADEAYWIDEVRRRKAVAKG